MTTHLPRSTRALTVIAAVVTCVACGDSSARSAREPFRDSAPIERTTSVIDSALPIPELLARLRATLADTPTVLVGGASSPEALVRALAGALRTHDTATVRALAVSRAEFAWLYYPYSKNIAPPYELPPSVLWLTLVASSDKGAGRLLERFGGVRLRIEQVSCPATFESEGPNSILRDCRVRFAVADSAARELRLFGTLLARDGRYKFLSYTNDL